MEGDELMYPVYKLIRAINRQYPNNGFISAVDVTEELNDGLIPEDFRDILNECIQDVYKDVAVDEVWTFPTVPGQKEYSLPEDCDLRDIQEVVRKYTRPVPPPPPPLKTHCEINAPTCEITYTPVARAQDGEDVGISGTGEMAPEEIVLGSEYTFPESTFTPPTGMEFDGWRIFDKDYYHQNRVYDVGDTITIYADLTVSAVWKGVE